MKDNIKPSILLSGFVSSFKQNGQDIYLITYNSNGKKVSNAEETFDPISLLIELQDKTNIDRHNLFFYIPEHSEKSNRLESMEQLEDLKNNSKVLIASLNGKKSQLQFCNLDGVERINIANYYGKRYYTHNNLDGSVEYLSIDDYENIILDEQGN